MKEFDLPLRNYATTEQVIAEIEQVARRQGLMIARSTLRQYPGSVHWHFKHSGSNGTLEATWFPQKQRLWLTYHDNRYKEWMEEKIEAFQQHFQTIIQQ